jgi:predicted esterase
MLSNTGIAHPHRDSPLLRQGSDLENAHSALLLLHGRGASAQDILGLAQSFALPADMIVLAPQARGNIWYPQRLTAPVEFNEPYLSSALKRIDEVVETLAPAGIPPERVILGGFSQGASLAIEFVLRRQRPWGGLLAFSGGYIWPNGQPRGAETCPAGCLAGMPVFLGCSDVDPFIPLERFEETAALLQAMGAQVNRQLYPDMGHTILPAEIDAAQPIISAAAVS